MTRYGSGSSLWPERSAGSKRVLFLKGSIHIFVGVAVFLIAAHAIADMVVLRPADAAGKADMAGGSGLCWRDWPDIQSGCPAGRAPPAALGAVTRTVPIVSDDRAPPRSAALAETPRMQTATLSRPVTTDGSGRRGETAATPVAQPAATPTPVAQPATAPTPLAQPAMAAAALTAKQSERELTFKQGYALRQAAAGRPAAAAPQKVANAKPKPRKQQRMPAQVYELPDGRTVVVRRPYGTSPVDARTNAGRFRSAEIAPQRFGQGFGEPFGARRGWFSQSGPSGLY